MSDSYNFQLEQFEGPLDLLLFLIKKNEVNIYDIPITKITEQYLEYLKYATSVNLEKITEFYVLAATLLYIKSRMLLPVEVDFSDEIEDPREELVAKLIDYQKFKKLSELMSEQEKSSEWVIERKKDQRLLPFSHEEDMWQEVEVWELLQSFSKIMGNLTQETIVNLYEEVSVNEKITLIQELLDEKGEFAFTDILINPESIMEIVCAFLAILESVKMKMILVYQNKLFGDILIRSTNYKEDKNGSEQGAIDY
jgi:segregation and condensation protein A